MAKEKMGDLLIKQQLSLTQRRSNLGNPISLSGMKELLNETTLRLCMGRISFWQYTFANLPRASTVKREFPRLYSLPLKRGWAPHHKKHNGFVNSDKSSLCNYAPILVCTGLRLPHFFLSFFSQQVYLLKYFKLRMFFSVYITWKFLVGVYCDKFDD